MDFKHFNVHWKLGQQRGKTCMTAFSKEDAKIAFEGYVAVDIPERRFDYPFEAEVIKVIGPLGMHESTDKQKLAHHYRWILGNITSAKAVLGRTKFKYVGLQASYDKVDRAYMLVDAQIAKLQRDVRDLFKIAGLKVK